MAVNLVQEGDPSRATRSSNLSALLSIRHRRAGKLDDLDQAIEYSRDAVSLASKGIQIERVVSINSVTASAYDTN